MAEIPFAVGARGDGPVRIDNAYLPPAHRASAHRGHSDRHGPVNAEEGHQNLRRSLFGDLGAETDTSSTPAHRPAGTPRPADGEEPGGRRGTGRRSVAGPRPPARLGTTDSG
ncbi:hypothetical protein ACFQ8C_20850 [Streptomyces sp. NPDC056503]|uniref:hypothetical protein n=1 Tax=Streptomyces sp. NPDC056503 TaxID=3345842 RepID=UPI0036C4DEAE